MGLGIENDVIQELSDRTAVGTVRAHYSTDTSGATFDGSTDWVDLGALNPGSPAFDLNKTIVDVPTGTPSTIKARHITSYAGTMSFEIIDYNDNAMNTAIGTSVGLEYVPATVSPANVTVVAGASTRSTVFLFTTTNIAVEDRLKFTLGTNFIFNEVKSVKAVDTTASTVTLDGTLSEIPAVGTFATKLKRVTAIIGGNKLKDYQLRMIASFNDNSFMVLHSAKGNFTGNINPNYADGNAIVKIPMQFGLIGSGETVSGFTRKQVVLAKHHAFYQ